MPRPLSTRTHCKICNEEFTELNSVYTKGYRQSNCKKCHNEQHNDYHKNVRQFPAQKEKQREYVLRKNYGLTKEQYDEMYRQQGGVCAICKKESNVEGRDLSVDHCHTANVVRGLLCTNCNVALGLLDDDEVIISNLLEYIKSYKDRYEFGS